MYAIIAKMLLKKLLSDPGLKTRVLDALRFEAKKTDTKIDDELVDGLGAIWDIALPIILGEVG